jgi:inner membrane protein
LPTKFSFSIDVRGSEQVYFSPLGKTTSVSLSSTWPNPSFIGEFLPESREVNKTGFNAQWKVLHLNRSFPQAWVNSQQQLQSSNFGVELLLPVDHYSNTLRSIKYAVLFVFLTFLVFFFIELFNKKQLHPIQYLLVGSALILFYLLLLSISEYLSFGLAYLISSLGICGLITGYTHGSLADKKITATVASFLVVLYGLLYILLQLQDYALLVGSLGLFLILAIVMYLTRKFNWYATNS